jgi:hypothetical protein
LKRCLDHDRLDRRRLSEIDAQIGDLDLVESRNREFDGVNSGIQPQKPELPVLVRNRRQLFLEHLLAGQDHAHARKGLAVFSDGRSLDLSGEFGLTVNAHNAKCHDEQGRPHPFCFPHDSSF